MMAPQSSSQTAPATHSQPSRKGKKAWRKNVDISEVTTGLDTLREEIRSTGRAIAEQSDDQLFAADTAGDEEIKRRHKLTKPLRLDQILAERSAVPAVDGRKRKSSALGDGIYDSSSSSKRRKEGWVAKKEVQRLRAKISMQNVLDGGGQAEVGGTDAEFDLWAVPGPALAVHTQTEQNEYIPQPRSKVAPATIHRAPIPMTASAKPTKSVSSPDAGTSYNPTFEAWAALITREGDKEVAAEEVRLAKAQADTERQARIDLIATKPDDGYDTGIEDAWEGFETESDAEGLKDLNKKRPGRKTPQQRKKAERRKEQERLAKHEAAMGRKQGQTEQAIMALIKAKQNENKDLVEPEDAEQRQQEEQEEYTTADAPLRRRRLGPVAIPERHLEVVLPDELQDSLRRLKPEGNLMTDRFRTLLVNGKVEARKRVLQPRKRKVKVTEKWSYKDFELPRIKA
ncbi:hypothetical protein DV736_g3893, partial [Chaetothyriales sp. CBS 134916]